MKKFLALLLAGVMTVSLVACGQTAAEAPVAEAETTTASEETPVAETEVVTADTKVPAAVQELIIGESEDMGGYDPMSNMAPFTIRALVFNTLIQLDYDYTMQPALAESWEMSEDGMVWTFHLRKGVTFHDGEPWNAEAAKFNWEERIAAGKDGTAGFLKAIDTMECPDEYTFVVNLNTPYFTFASEVTPPMYSMVSPKAFDENHEVAAAIGTGAFKLDSWTKDTEIVLVKNENYWDGAPQLDKVTFKVITDSNARALALESGQIDMMSGRSALTSLETLKKQENIQIIKTMGQTSVFCLMNTHCELLSDIRMREAIAHAVDFKSTVPALLSDLAEPAENLFSPVFGEFIDPAQTLPEYDAAKSTALLTELGYSDTDGDGYLDKDGEKLTIDVIVTANNEEDKALCAIMQDQLKEIGIELTITPLDGATLKTSTTSGEYQLAMQGQNYVPNNDPTINYTGYWTSSSLYNIYSDDTLDAMVAELRASLDAQERLTMHKQIQAYILDKTPLIMVFHRNNIILADEKVQDFQIAAGTWQLYKGLEKTWIAE